MAKEFEDDPRKREQAKRDLDDLMRIMEQMHIAPASPDEIEEDGEEDAPPAPADLSFDALIERAASAAEAAEEPNEAEEPASAWTEDEPEKAESGEAEPETAPEEPKPAETPAEAAPEEPKPEEVPAETPPEEPKPVETPTETAPEEPKPAETPTETAPEEPKPEEAKPAGEAPQTVEAGSDAEPPKPERPARKRTRKEKDAKETKQQAQREAILDEQSRRRHPEQPTATIHLGQEQPKAKKPAAKSKKKKQNRRARARRRRLLTLCALVVIALVVIVLLVSAVRAMRGSGKTVDTAGSANVTTSQTTEQPNDTSDLPASQQESEQYLAIKDDGSLPSYAKEYPGLYADAASTEKTLSDSKVCYLTFDDGPSSTCTPKILDILKEYNVKATFFVVTSEIDGHEDILKRIVDEGHTLCIHANVHKYSEIYASTEAYLQDFATAYDKIYEITGYRVQGFRFPGGSNGRLVHYGNYDAIVQEMNRRGFEYYDWNAYDHDAENGNYTADQLKQYALHEVSVSSRNDAILLMHDTYGKESTVEALPGIIEGLQADGIQMLPITNSTRPVHFEVDETTPAEYTETPAATEDSTTTDGTTDSSTGDSSTTDTTE